MKKKKEIGVRVLHLSFFFLSSFFFFFLFFPLSFFHPPQLGHMASGCGQPRRAAHAPWPDCDPCCPPGAPSHPAAPPAARTPRRHTGRPRDMEHWLRRSRRSMHAGTTLTGVALADRLGGEEEGFRHGKLGAAARRSSTARGRRAKVAQRRRPRHKSTWEGSFGTWNMGGLRSWRNGGRGSSRAIYRAGSGLACSCGANRGRK